MLTLLFLLGLGISRFFENEVNPWIPAIISLTIFTSAYLADVWRVAIGLKFLAILGFVYLSQSFRIALAPKVGFMVKINKGSSLAYIISFQDLVLIGKRWTNSPIIGTETFVIFQIMACIYFCLCFP